MADGEEVGGFGGAGVVGGVLEGDGVGLWDGLHLS